MVNLSPDLQISVGPILIRVCHEFRPGLGQHRLGIDLLGAALQVADGFAFYRLQAGIQASAFFEHQRIGRGHHLGREINDPLPRRRHRHSGQNAVDLASIEAGDHAVKIDFDPLAARLHALAQGVAQVNFKAHQ